MKSQFCYYFWCMGPISTNFDCKEFVKSTQQLSKRHKNLLKQICLSSLTNSYNYAVLIVDNTQKV